ncbi:MAG: protein kinase, partial [Planctomycetota bacterium]
MESQDTLLGKVLGNCRLIKKIGEGGMGTVYQAHHLGLNKPVAVKILPPSFAREPERIQRFIREARSAAQLEHSNIVQTLNVGKQDDLYFIIMQYVQGENLDMMIKRKNKLTASEATKIIRESAVALGVAHQKGIIHRDVKPENIMITLQGEIKLMDFGLARVMDEVSNLSRAGDIMGTPHYLAPEQAQGHPVDHRSDIYSLGVTYYYALTGERPFEGTTPMTVILKHLNAPMPDPRTFSTDLPNSVYRIVKKMMEKQPAHRYQNTGELIKELDLIQPALAQSGGTASQKTITHSSAPPAGTSAAKNKKLFFYLSTAAAVVILLVALIMITGKRNRPNSSNNDKIGNNGPGQPPFVPVRPKIPAMAELLAQAKTDYTQHPNKFETNIANFQKIIDQYPESNEAAEANLLIKDVKKKMVEKNLEERITQFFYYLKKGNSDAVMNYLHPDLKKEGEEKVKVFLEWVKESLRWQGKIIKEITINAAETKFHWIRTPPRASVSVNITYSNQSGETETEERKSEWRLKDGVWYFFEGEKLFLPDRKKR